MLIYHGDTLYYTFLKKIGANPSGKFAPILTDTPVKNNPVKSTCPDRCRKKSLLKKSEKQII